MNALIPLVPLKNGVELPALGLGVFQSPPAETVIRDEGRESGFQ